MSFPICELIEKGIGGSKIIIYVLEFNLSSTHSNIGKLIISLIWEPIPNLAINIPWSMVSFTLFIVLSLSKETSRSRINQGDLYSLRHVNVLFYRWYFN